MEPMGRTGVTRWLLLGLALAIAPALSACASLGLFQAEPPAVSEAPPELPPAVEPQRPPEFPELAVGAQIVDAPEMAEALPAAEPPAANAVPRAPAAAPRRPAPTRQASVQPPNPPVSAAPRTVEPAELVGFNFDSVLTVLRQPDAVEKNALSVVWTYAGSDCTLQLYFYPDIRTAVFRLLKYELKGSSGEKLNGGGVCMQPMMATRKDGSQSQR
jgi:hypothetical protein